MQNLQINSGRLWDSLMEMAKIGATREGRRVPAALTDLDKQGRDLFIRWCKEAGCTRRRRPRRQHLRAPRRAATRSFPPVMTGSHLDTQPTGGRFDGVYGVLAGLEVLRTLNDSATRPMRRSNLSSGPTRKARASRRR